MRLYSTHPPNPLQQMVGVFDGWTELLSQVLPSQSAARLAQASEVAINIAAPPQKQGDVLLFSRECMPANASYS